MPLIAASVRLGADGVSTFNWDAESRLLGSSNATTAISYTYNGLGQRVAQFVQQTVNGMTGTSPTQYVIDTQPCLWQVLQATLGGTSTTSYVHGPMGLHEQYGSGATTPQWMVQDGLGSIRSVLDNSINPLESRAYLPYGEVIQTSGSTQTMFGFTGEPTDANGLVYLRARYLNPALSQFLSLDPMETPNRFQYASANPINFTDPSGLVNIAPNNDGGDGGSSSSGSAVISDLFNAATQIIQAVSQVASNVVNTVITPQSQPSVTTSTVQNSVQPAQQAPAASSTPNPADIFAALMSNLQQTASGIAAGMSSHVAASLASTSPQPVQGYGTSDDSGDCGLDIGCIVNKIGTAGGKAIENAFSTFGHVVDSIANEINSIGNLLSNSITNTIKRLLGGGSNDEYIASTGDCTASRHRELQDDVNLQCKKKPSSCSDFMPCNQLASYRERNSRCFLARLRINRECFKGGNVGHLAAQAQAATAWWNCVQIYRKNC